VFSEYERIVNNEFSNGQKCLFFASFCLKNAILKQKCNNFSAKNADFSKKAKLLSIFY